VLSTAKPLNSPVDFEPWSALQQPVVAHPRLLDPRLGDRDIEPRIPQRR